MDTLLRLSHFIAQCGHECDGFATYEEYASGEGYEGRKDLGNVKPGDGKRYKGRGPIQLTGRSNYRAATPYVRKLINEPGIDLEATPEIVSTDKRVGFATSLWFWTRNGLNDWADRNDAKAVSRGVNRGNPRSEKPANHEAERIALTAVVLAMLTEIQKRPGNAPAVAPVTPPAPAPVCEPPVVSHEPDAPAGLWGKIKGLFS